MEAIVISTRDIVDYQSQEMPLLDLVIDGRIPRSYTEQVDKVDPGSRMLPIGGFTAQVRAKYASSVTLYENQELASTRNALGLRGSVTPARAGQAVQVVLTDPLNRLRVQNVTTGAAPVGQFSVVFDLTHAPTEDPIRGTPGPAETPVTGVYRARAYIVNAEHLAQSQSSEVIINK